MACPSCGDHPRYPPFRKRFLAHLVIALAAGGLLLALAVCTFIPSESSSLGACYNLSASACGFTVIAIIAHLIAECVVALRRPDWREVKRALRDGRLIEEEPGEPPAPVRRRQWVWAAFSPVVVAAIVCLIPFVAVSDGEWPRNPDLQSYLSSVGPDDWAVIDGNLQVQSIHGVYYYTGSVEHLNPKECGQTFNFRLDPEVKHIGGAHKIRTNNAKFGEHKPADVRLRLRAPDDGALYNRTIRLRVTAVVQYPVWRTEETFDLRDETVVREITIRTVPREPAERFRGTVRIVVPVAAVLYLSGAAVLLVANSRRRPSRPSEGM